jgi:hypothetical protein
MTDRRMLWIGVGNAIAGLPRRATPNMVGSSPNARRIKAMRVTTLLRIE